MFITLWMIVHCYIVSCSFFSQVFLTLPAALIRTRTPAIWTAAMSSICDQTSSGRRKRKTRSAAADFCRAARDWLQDRNPSCSVFHASRTPVDECEPSSNTRFYITCWISAPVAASIRITEGIWHTICSTGAEVTRACPRGQTLSKYEVC